LPSVVSPFSIHIGGGSAPEQMWSELVRELGSRGVKALKWEDVDLDAFTAYNERTSEREYPVKLSLVASAEGYAYSEAGKAIAEASEIMGAMKFDGLATLVEGLAFVLHLLRQESGQILTRFRDFPVYCGGSVFNDGGIPGLSFSHGIFRISWFHPDLFRKGQFLLKVVG